MKMVVHEHVGVNGNAEFRCVLLQEIEQKLPVSRGEKNRLAVVTALNDVVRLTGKR